MRYALAAAWDCAAWGCWAIRLRWSPAASLQARIDRYGRHTSPGYTAALIGAGQRAGLNVDHL